MFSSMAAEQAIVKFYWTKEENYKLPDAIINYREKKTNKR